MACFGWFKFVVRALDLCARKELEDYLWNFLLDLSALVLKVLMRRRLLPTSY